MKQKLLIVFLCALSFAVTVANAADIKVEKGQRTVTVSQNIEADSKAMLIVVKAGADVANDDEFYAVKYANSDTAGKAVWSFGMPERKNGVLTDGKYDLYIKEHGKTVKSDTMVYASVETRQNIEDDLKLVTSEADFVSIIENPEYIYGLEVLGFDTTEYASIQGDKSKVQNMAYNGVESFSSATVSEISSSLNTAMAVQGINVCSSDKIEYYLQVANPSFENVSFTEITDEALISSICTYIDKKTYESPEQLKTAYNAANILYLVNTSRVDYLESLFSKYVNELGLSSSSEYSRYVALADKTSADDSIARLRPFADISAVKIAIGNAVPNNGSGGGNGGGSSGGSSGGASGGGNSSSSNSSGGVALPIPSITGIPSDSVSKEFFSDLSEAVWASDAINQMAKEGIVSGDENGKFHPNDVLTREAFVKMLVETVEVLDATAECDFDDVDNNAWYYRYVASAVNAGLVYGTSDRMFGVGNQLTRQDMAVLCYRAAQGRKEYGKVRENVVFGDDSEIAAYAKEAVCDLYMAGVVNGTGGNKFEPMGTATRAQGAMIIYNLFLNEVR